jgi:hypothetical protein
MDLTYWMIRWLRFLRKVWISFLTVSTVVLALSTLNWIAAIAVK